MGDAEEVCLMSSAFIRAMVFCLLSFLTVFGFSVADDSSYLGTEEASKIFTASSTTEGAAIRTQGQTFFLFAVQYYIINRPLALGDGGAGVE